MRADNVTMMKMMMMMCMVIKVSPGNGVVAQQVFDDSTSTSGEPIATLTDVKIWKPASYILSIFSITRSEGHEPRLTDNLPCIGGGRYTRADDCTVGDGDDR